MSCQKGVLLTVTLSACIGTILALSLSGCTQKDITCAEIWQANVYRYSYECPTGSKVHVIVNETKIAFAKLGSDLSTHKYQHPEMRIFNSSFLTPNCSDLSIKCISEEGGLMKDSCWTYWKTTGKETPIFNDSHQGLNITVGAPVGGTLSISAVVIIVICGIIVIIVICVMLYQCWKKNAATSGFSLCCLFRDSQGIFQNGMSATQSAKGPCDDNKRNNELETVEVQRTQDPQAGETPDTLSQNHIGIEEETQAKDGGTNVSDEVPHSRDMHRNQRDDPGGVNRIKADGIVGTEKTQNGWTHGERGPEDDEQNEKNESEPLLPIQGGPCLNPTVSVCNGANQHSDMTGEATVLVDKSCFNPDPDSKYSITLDTDVESAHYMMKPRINK